MDHAEELHKESLEILAKLASSATEYNDLHNNVIRNHKVSKCAKKNKKNICNNCQQVKCCGLCEKENGLPNTKAFSNSEVLKTPQKHQRSMNDPITPTANLKMLVCAASVLTPASSVEEEKRRLFVDNVIIAPKPEPTEEREEELESKDCKISKKGQLLGRKEKSLGLLCKRFMLIYPEHSPNGTTILLDDVVKALGIGRRRVYDIVNVLESMEMMIRQAKNKYLWYGKSRLPATLTKLKALALRVYGKNFCHILQQYQHILPKNNVNEEVNQRNPLSVLTNPQVPVYTTVPPTIIPTTNIPILPKIEETLESRNKENEEKPEFDDITSSIMDYIITYDSTRKDNSRSLGILCQKFLMLFMVVDDSIVTLDRAAKLLLNEHDDGPGKYKTKVRRLYDIANILTSIKFLEKTTSYENATKKAAYKWVGLDLKSLDSEEEIKKAFQTLEFSVTRHSLLAQVPRIPSDINSQRKLQCRSASAHQLTSPGSILKSSSKLKFPRTFSATTVPTENIDDGFDIAHFNEVVSEESVSETGDESPNQALFKEKLRKLQAEFPDKLPNNGLLELLSACKNPMSVKPNLRRSLSGDFDNKSSSPPKKIKLDTQIATTIASTQSDVLPKTQQGAAAPSLAALKPLLSYSNLGKQPIKVAQTARRVTVTSPISKNWQPSATFLTVQAALNGQYTTPSDNRQCQPMLVSAVGNPISLQKGGGLYQIIPIQCKPMNHNEKSMHGPMVIGQHQPQLIQHPASAPSTNVVTMLMRPPIVTVTSPSVLLSPRNPVLRKSGNDFLTNQQLDKYPEYFTPPHAMLQHVSNGKPPANPIIFPKMTPETPSSDPKSVLTAVTRKLMSFQNEESG